MVRKMIVAGVIALGLVPGMLGYTPAVSASPARGARSYTYVYRVWFKRYNRYTKKSWWEIYTTTNSQDRAAGVVSLLQSRGYSAYWDVVKRY